MTGLTIEEIRELNRCAVCGGDLDPDDRGLTRKFVNRGATRFLCIHCLSEKVGISEDVLRERAEEFKAQGCLMFR